MRALRTSCAVLGVLLCAGRAQGQMTPIHDGRENHAQATFVGVTESMTEYPSAPFAFFNSFLNPYVPNPDPEGPGSCQAAAFQVSQFFPAGISGSGMTSGSWNTLAAGTYGGLSLTSFTFRVDATLDYTLDAWVEPGDFLGSGEFLLEAEPSGVKLHDIFSGELHLTGRLSPGLYHIEGRSSFGTSVETFQGGTYSFQFVVSSTQNPLILVHPASLVTPCDASAEFSVTTAPPPGSLTFQWRRNGAPLANGSHISGATSPTLTIHDPCYPDTGYYDVVVSNGVEVEPSSAARLDIGGTTAVAPGAPASRRMVALSLAGPNPFARETAFRYVATEAGDAEIAIYDIAGARIRTLAKRVPAGSGVVQWDGSTSAGTRAPAGVYFGRIEAGGLSGTCRTVKLN